MGIQKFVFVAGLLMLSAISQAEHHRDHVKGALADHQIFIDGTRSNLDAYFSDFGPMTAEEASNANAIYSHLYTVEKRMKQIASAMDYYALNLEDERRRLNQPDYNVGPHSVLRRLSTMIYKVARFIDLHPTRDNTLLAATYINISTLQGMAVTALWHLNDAVREEIYLDPEFQ